MIDSFSPEQKALEVYDKVADQFAQHSQNSAHNAYCERPCMIDLLPNIVENLHALDAGCGNGFYSEWLFTHEAKVTAFDGSSKMVELVQKNLGGKIDVRKHDLTQPLNFLNSESFDLVLCPLVLDHIENLREPFSEFYRVLRRSGLLIFSLGHPTHDFIKLGQNYFDTELVEENFPTLGVVIPYYRRPLNDILDPLLETGFMLQKLVEPKPIEECKQLHPKLYERLSKRPSFLCIRAKKP